MGRPQEGVSEAAGVDEDNGEDRGGADAADARSRLDEQDGGSRPSSAGPPSDGQGSANGVRWEPFLEDEPRPAIHPEEYARRLTMARRRMVQQHAASSQRGGANS